jgi:hypothetical protein
MALAEASGAEPVLDRKEVSDAVTNKLSEAAKLRRQAVVSTTVSGNILRTRAARLEQDAQLTSWVLEQFTDAGSVDSVQTGIELVGAAVGQKIFEAKGFLRAAFEARDTFETIRRDGRTRTVSREPFVHLQMSLAARQVQDVILIYDTVRTLVGEDTELPWAGQLPLADSTSPFEVVS